jgi:transcriptional regulator
MPKYPDPDMLQGTLDMLILKTVALGPIHGYGIAMRIQQVTEDVLRVRQGSLYPALYRLERKRWIDYEWGTSENGRRAKYYRLTKQGRKQLATETESWDRLSTAVNRLLQTT